MAGSERAEWWVVGVSSNITIARMSGVEERVSIGAMPAAASGTDRYNTAVDDEYADDDYGDEDFSTEEPAPQPQHQFMPAAGESAAPAADAASGTLSERVQDFIKKSSLASGKLDDKRLVARPLFGELLQSKRLSEWNEGECVVWLSNIGLERYRALFFHHHVSGKTLEKMTSEKLRDEVGIGALGHRELIMDEIEDLKAKNSEFLKKLNKRRNEKRQLEKGEERKLEALHMDLLRFQVEHRQAQDALEKAQKLERQKLEVVERQRWKIDAFQQELKKNKKEEAVQNYGRISDLKQCTFRPTLTMTSVQFAENSERGEMWDRVKTDMLQKQQKMKDIQRVNENQAGIKTRDRVVREAEQFMIECVPLHPVPPSSACPRLRARIAQLDLTVVDLGCRGILRYTNSRGEFKNSMVEQALDQGMVEGHCEPDEKEKILKKKGDDKLIATYNVLRIHKFLGKYESDLNVRRSRNKPGEKQKLTREQREEREAAIDHLVSRMHPAPPVKDSTRKETPEQKAARKQQKEQNKKLIEHFLENYAEDMHKRRLHMKQVRARAVPVFVSVPSPSTCSPPRPH